MPRKLTNEEFIKVCTSIHQDRYDYSKTVYPGSRDSKEKITVICKEHGDFLITVYNHMVNRHGCIECADSRKVTQKKFIKKIIEMHGDRYDLSKTIYSGKTNSIEVICKAHGIFTTTPQLFIRFKVGCPICKEPYGERLIALILTSKRIEFTRQVKFKDCRDKYPLSYDFLIPNSNVLIERQGIQHYQFYPEKGKRSFHKNWDNFESQVRRDKIKREWAKANGYRLLVIPFWYKTYEDIEWFLSENL